MKNSNLYFDLDNKVKQELSSISTLFDYSKPFFRIFHDDEFSWHSKSVDRKFSINLSKIIVTFKEDLFEDELNNLGISIQNLSDSMSLKLNISQEWNIERRFSVFSLNRKIFENDLEILKTQIDDITEEMEIQNDPASKPVIKVLKAIENSLRSEVLTQNSFTFNADLQPDQLPLVISRVFDLINFYINNSEPKSESVYSKTRGTIYRLEKNYIHTEKPFLVNFHIVKEPCIDKSDEQMPPELNPLIEFIKQLYELDEVLNFCPAFQTLLEDQEIEDKDKVVMYSESSHSISYFLPDECTVKFYDNLNISEANSIIHNSNVILKKRTPGYYVVSVPEKENLFQTIERLNALPEVEFAEPSEFGVLSQCSNVQNDWATNYQKIRRKVHLYNQVNKCIETHEALKCWPLQTLRLTDAWNLSRGNPQITIVFIDTLVSNHKAFENARFFSLDLCSTNTNIQKLGSEKSKNIIYSDASSKNIPHGTQVVGVVAGVDSTSGFLGVAPACSFLSLGVNLSNGMYENLVDAFDYVIRLAQKHRSHKYIINCSWHITTSHYGLRSILDKAINSEHDNILIVASAGNCGRDVRDYKFYPAISKQALTVAATDINDQFWPLSNRGEDIDLCAPGVDIWTTSLDKPDNDGKIPEIHYGYTSDRGSIAGTSFSAPYVAAVAALIWSVCQPLKSNEVKDILVQSCIGYTLKPIPSTVKDIPDKGINAIFIKYLGSSYHIRIFDNHGTMVREIRDYNPNEKLRLLLGQLFKGIPIDVYSRISIVQNIAGDLGYTLYPEVENQQVGAGIVNAYRAVVIAANRRNLSKIFLLLGIFPLLYNLVAYRFLQKVRAIYSVFTYKQR